MIPNVFILYNYDHMKDMVIIMIMLYRNCDCDNKYDLSQFIYDHNYDHVMIT